VAGDGHPAEFENTPWFERLSRFQVGRFRALRAANAMSAIVLSSVSPIDSC
jgi:hypothetical protein